jgi:hypothetical protein
MMHGLLEEQPACAARPPGEASNQACRSSVFCFCIEVQFPHPTTPDLSPLEGN